MQGQLMGIEMKGDLIFFSVNIWYWCVSISTNIFSAPWHTL